MIVEQDLCVSCDLPCLGNDCPLKNVSRNICDECEENDAEYMIDNSSLCETCANEFVDEQWGVCDLFEKCKMLGIDFKYIGG